MTNKDTFTRTYARECTHTYMQKTYATQSYCNTVGLTLHKNGENEEGADWSKNLKTMAAKTVGWRGRTGDEVANFMSKSFDVKSI